jgi:hypothetical protein
MKLLTLYIDRRLDYVIDFDCREEYTDVLGQFVVEAEDDDIPLLSFYSSDKISYNNGLILQDSKERIAYIKEISAIQTLLEDKQKAETIQVDIHLTTAKTNYEDKALNERYLKFQEESDKKKWTLTYHRSLQIEYALIDVFIHLYDENEVRTRNVKLYVSGADRIADVVLDFGSEASQMTTFKRDEAQNVNGIMPLIEDMNRLYGGESDYKNYLQYDESEKGLYKSIFFAKKEWTREDGNNCTASILLDEESNKPIVDAKVLVLTSKDRKEEIRHTYLNLPNVKIINFGGVREPSILYNGSSKRISDFKNNFFYRRCINHFIFNALNSISTEDDISFVTLYLLMPNIYSYNKIFDNLYWVSIDIQEMLEYFPRIKGVEVSMISESDASLLGAICSMRNEALSDGNYLVLDAGKGTLDFSVLQVSSEPHLIYKNLYRSGIVGAGNAISYAYLLAILDHFYYLNTGQHPTASNLREYIYYNVLGASEESRANQGGDAFYLKELMEAVDDYKIAVGEKRGIQIKEESLTNNLEDIKDVQLSTLVDYIKGLVKDETYQLLSEEELQYVDKTILLIVESVTSKLATMKNKTFTSINDVIFAGRGFEYQPLKKCMINQLRARNIIDKDTNEITVANTASAATPKIICLYLSEALINGQYNNRMIVVPAVAKARIINERKPSTKSNGSYLKRIWRRLCGDCTSENGQEIQESEKERLTLDFQNLINIVCNDIYYPGEDSSLNGMVKGFSVPISSSRDLLIVGSTTYKLGISINGEARFFYGEDKLFLRDEYKHEVHELKLGVDLETSSLVFASLFPACNPHSKEQIFIPEIECKLIERKSETGTNKKEENKIREQSQENSQSSKKNNFRKKQSDDEKLIDEIKKMKGINL